MDFTFRRRGVLAISIAILKAARKGIRTTHLLYSARLSCEQLNRYIDLLEDRDFIERRGTLYKTTDRGFELIEEFESSPLTRSILTT